MVTINYESAGMMVDEEHWDNLFWTEAYHDEIIAVAFDWPHIADPGTRWVYRTSDIFIATRVLHTYLGILEGTDSDIFEFVVEKSTNR